MKQSNSARKNRYLNEAFESLKIFCFKSEKSGIADFASYEGKSFIVERSIYEGAIIKIKN